MPPSIKQGFLEAEVLFANEYFGFFVEAESPAIHHPFRAVLHLLSLVLRGCHVCLPAHYMLPLLARGIELRGLGLGRLLGRNGVQRLPYPALRLLT